MTTRFFVGIVFRIALAGICESILHVGGRCRIGLLSELFECLTLDDEAESSVRTVQASITEDQFGRNDLEQTRIGEQA